MANFEPKKLDLDDINGGIRFTESDGVTPNAINDPIEAVAYSQTVVEHLTDTPDISEINGVGNPNVSFVSSTTADGVTIYKFKFSNLSGATFTPSLDEAGNLSWSNNRNLPNPPTINISGRDYLFSSEVLSGTYIPQVNSEVTDMPLTSFNRAPVDDIDHCYLFYYYTPENIYYWLATQVVDIQETTATLKILSVVRLTGYTPTIGENGNWVINGEDTGKPSYGASGVTDVVAGASYNQDDFTVTPLTFNFEVGNSKTVNVKAAVGNVEDGSYAKLAQVVRVDAAQSLTDAEKTRAKDNVAISTGKNAAMGISTGWYRVAKLKRLSAYSVTIGQVYNFTEPQIIKLALNLGYQNAIITQESGIISGVLKIDRVRVCVGTTSDAFFDVHIFNANFNTTKISIDRLYNSDNAVAIETYADWEYLGTDDTVSGYNVTQLDMVSGTNTSGQVYQQGEPVLVGDQSAIFESDGTTVKNAANATNADKATKATQDANGNVINTTYAKLTQAVRTDVVSSNSDEQKRVANENTLRYITGSPVSAGWYRVATLSGQGIYEINVSSTYNINAPVAIKFIVAVSTSSGYNTSITQIGGAPNLTIVTQARLNQDSGNLYFEIYVANPNNAIGVSYKAVTSLGDGLFVSNITPVAFTNIASPSNVIAAIRVVCGINTTGGIYSNGAPVLVGFDSPKLSGTIGSVKLPDRGWYCINYKATSLVQWYSTGVFYWGGKATCLPVSAYSLSTVSIIKRAVNISSDGTVTVFDPDSGTRYTDFTVEIYELA